MFKMFLVGGVAVFAAEMVGGLSFVTSLSSPLPTVIKYLTGGAVVAAGHRFLKT